MNTSLHTAIHKLPGRQAFRKLLRSRAMLAGFGAVLLWAANMVTAAAHGTADHQASPHAASAAGKRSGLGTSAAFDPTGRLWVLSKGEQETGSLVLRHSNDLGASWSRAIRVLAEPEPVAATGQERPRIVFGNKGELYIAYTRPVAKPHVGDIRFVRSLDGGKTFSSPITVHANRDSITHAFGNMIVDGEGNIVIAWIDGRDALQAKKTNAAYTGSALYYAVSRNSGASFQGDYKIADHACECCRIAMARNAQGQAVVMWRHVFAPNVRDHALAALSPAGLASRLQRVTFDDWRIDACPHHGPSLAYSSDGVRHQAWFHGRQDKGGVYYAAAAAAAGGSSGPPGRTDPLGSMQAGQADLAISGSRIAIAWKEFDGKQTTLRSRISTDGGSSWHEQVAAQTRGASDHPFLVSGPPGIALVWHTRDEGVRVIPMGERP